MSMHKKYEIKFNKIIIKNHQKKKKIVQKALLNEEPHAEQHSSTAS